MRALEKNKATTVLGVILLTIVPAAAARAGVYTVHSCRTPGAASASSITEWSSDARLPALSRRAAARPLGRYSIELLPTAAHPSNDLDFPRFRGHLI